ncbi:MAG: hypothetical protein U0441_11110 [Polyangiaceae bacterium]
MAAPSMDVRYRWTAMDEGLANTPKDQIVTKKGQDPPTITPYGIHRKETRTMLHVASKTQKTVAQMKEGDEVMVPLAYSTSGLESRATRFFRAGYRWEKLPQDSTGKPTVWAPTLGELCQAVYEWDKKRFSHYDLSHKGEAWDFPRRVWKLFDYWEHTDYRYAVVKSGKFSWGMNPLQIPTEAPDPADATKTQRCLWVLGKIPEKAVVSAAPSSQGAEGDGKNTNAVALPAGPDYDKDPGPPFDKLHPELLATIKRSYKARMLRTPQDAVYHLDSVMSGNDAWQLLLITAWQNKGALPDERLTLDEVLDSMATAPMNILVRLFDRIRAVDPSFGLWRQIKFLRDGWLSGSAGFKVVYFDPEAMRSCLDSLGDNTSGNKIARDKLIGSLDHQYTESWKTYPGAQAGELLGPPFTDFPPPDVDTWREVDKPQEEALHFCVDKQDINPCLQSSDWVAGQAVRHHSSDDIHIDWRSPVQGIDYTKKCIYDDNFAKKAWHVAQAKWGIGVPEDRFVGTYLALKECRDRRDLMKDDAEWNAELDSLDKEWADKKWGLALDGKRGWENASPYYERAKALVAKLHSTIVSVVRF